MNYSPRSGKESDLTERARTHTHAHTHTQAELEKQECSCRKENLNNAATEGNSTEGKYCSIHQGKG